jgi:hypothetical protein
MKPPSVNGTGVKRARGAQPSTIPWRKGCVTTPCLPARTTHGHWRAEASFFLPLSNTRQPVQPLHRPPHTTSQASTAAAKARTMRCAPAPAGSKMQADVSHVTPTQETGNLSHGPTTPVPGHPRNNWEKLNTWGGNKPSESSDQHVGAPMEKFFCPAWNAARSGFPKLPHTTLTSICLDSGAATIRRRRVDRKAAT